MPSFPPTVPRKAPRPSTGGGGRGPIDREPRGGGGGGGRGDDHLPNYAAKLKRYRLALMVTVVSIVMLFMATTVLFVARKNGGHYDIRTGRFVSDWVPVELPIRVFLLNTAVLLLGSLTAEKARRSAAMDAIIIPASRVPGVAAVTESSPLWVHATTLIGFAFLVGQWFAWEDMHQRGIFLATGPSSTFVFLFTGAHAVHLAGGILVLIWATLMHRARKSLDSRRITLDVSALYWHFMGLLWLYVLGIFLLLG